ncbi:MAG TPA: phosphate ABC transporter permease subunit PstC [Bacteroidaceae bacterium]|jgi:phosphate transport system permease protein|nr:phosphate ABC transporter permease subunit PstC [Bacteroidaceae bacterium]MBP8602624.1 phosphate ABC transporter permease subunit PstC [Bacteroidaceae bacterium]OPZ47565.1 MAG: Phosphate transport system permease protein PstC [Bacteroidetes bacterium ADurb.BinA104]HOD68710.1 phosphate ABC transporter permease subunit PstC [Bacteroidaceae bacterium]HQL26181.1 phosphate ABC transporter permease subunit PstC [Bacteroidaceae bacterium]
MNDKLYRAILFIAAVTIPVVCGGVLFALVTDAHDAFEHFGFFRFITSSEWSYTEGAEQYGALPFITGTLLTTLLALLFCIPFSLPVAFFVGEYFKGTRVAAVLSTVTDLLAGIPSIIYGLWGFYTLRPVIIALNISPQGSGILTASLVLAIMIVPYAASLSAEFIKMVPNELKESAYSLGATRAEVVRNIIFPVAGSGIFSSYILAIGRALGETMTVTMLIGNTNNMPTSITSTGNSMASIIANQFGEADGLRLSSLIAIGLILFLITAIINVIGKMMIKRARII